jgi:hypothetical protein
MYAKEQAQGEDIREKILGEEGEGAPSSVRSNLVHILGINN